MQCIAIDDEPLALDVVREFCKRVPQLELKGAFTKTSEASVFLSNNKIELVFLDIQMPDMTGLEFHKLLSDETMVIFTTAYSEYAVEGFNLDAVDYLLKPFQFARFEKAIKKALEYQKYVQKSATAESDQLFVRSEYSLVKISQADILYIETMDDYLKIHLPGKKPVMTLMTMKTIMEKLAPEKFVRVHRSYIVPMAKIESVRGKVIDLGITEIPIGASYEEAFFKVYTKSGFY
jgi:DNA-binding LytR/AlgR family response regulator